MSTEPFVTDDAERVLDRITPILAADTLDGALAQAARLLGPLTQSFATAIFAVEDRHVAGEAWHPTDEARRGRLRAHLRSLALESVERGAPVETPFSAHVTTGLVPHVHLLEAGGRRVGALCFARLPSPESAPDGRETVVVQIARVLACKVLALLEAEVSRAAGVQHERWFRQLDSHIRVLDRERQKFAAVVNQTDTYVFTADAGGRLTWANRAMAECFPVDGEGGTWVGKECREACARFGDGGCGKSGEGCPVALAAESGRPTHREFCRSGPDGPLSLYATACPIKGPEGRTQEVLVLVQNLSELETLKRSEMRHRLLFERGANAIVMVDPENHRIVLANPMASRMLNVPADAMPDRSIRDFFGVEVWRDLCARIEKLEPEGMLQIPDCTVHTASGEPRTANVYAVRFDLDGRLVILIELNDITERRRAEEALRAAEARVQTVVSNSPIVLFAIDRDGLFTLSEGRGLAALGLEPGEVVGRSVWDLYRDVPQILDNVRRALAGEEFSAAVQVGSLTFETRYAPARDAAGEITGVIGIATDVTELRTLEEQLRQTWKMEALGRLAGGVAHDFNNLLTVIMGRTQMILSQLGPEHAARRGVEEVQKAGVCAALLTRQLLSFSRRELVAPRVLDLRAVIGDLENMLERLIGEDITLDAHLDGGPAWVRADRGQMEQVIMNLVVNARDAMPEGGRIEIRLDRAELSAERQTRQVALKAGDYVTLTVTDAGCGMDPEIQSRLFEPFFTTKERGRGTGLGLSLVYNIVQASGGQIEVESEVGRGTSVCIYLLGERSAEQPGREALAAPRTGGNETVLLAEDEDAVRALAREILRAGGYRVLEAGHGLEALEVARTHDGPIHLVVSDVVMPHMGGGELVRRLEAMRPGIRVLYMSGHHDDTVVRQGILTERVAFIQKPFDVVEFARTVRAALDADAPGGDRAAA